MEFVLWAVLDIGESLGVEVFSQFGLTVVKIA
jgi:hypothetical protein